MSEKKNRLVELEAAMQKPDFWQNKERAKQVVAEYERLKVASVGGGKYDAGSAVITIFSGAGGDDAEDFSRMLFEMYLKYAERCNFSAELIHQNKNDHGGFRSVTFLMRGKGAYGILKNESGVHRLVRVSPFSAKKLRHTSFSMVEVIPDFKTKDMSIELAPEDLKTEFARSSGPGGQNVNKRETAVRVTHLPTGLVVHLEAERSQERNRERALAILRAKLYRREEEQRRSEEQGFYVSKTTEAEWGHQIRSYVLHPYKMVKDHRTNVETSDVEAVLEGKLEPFLEAEHGLL